jgi:hypothetical protein
MPPVHPHLPKVKKPFNILFVIIPAGAVAVVAITFVVLLITGVFDNFGSDRSSSADRPSLHGDDDRGTLNPRITPTPPDRPDPSPPTDPGYPTFRAASWGDYIWVNGSAYYEFSPAQSGRWIIFTSENSVYDPYLELLDHRGHLITWDDDSGGNSNAFISVELDERMTYTIFARFFTGDSGSYLLNIEFVPDEPYVDTLTLSGFGDARWVTAVTDFEFTPALSGWWSIYTFDNFDSDPLLEVYDRHGNLFASDDDSGDGSNAYLYLYLEAWTTYIIRARYWSDGSGSYMLIVSSGDDGAGEVGISIPGTGGDLWVNGPSNYEFTPTQSGWWVFYTRDNVGDPYLYVYDWHWNLLAEDDDGGGDLNSYISVYLEAWNTYYIHAGFFGDGTGSYTLSVFMS